jgi:hypothetical protein
MTTPRTKFRNMPHINATVFKWQEEWIQGMAESSGMRFSQVLRDLISRAYKQGYTPGTTTISDIRHSSSMRTGVKPE